MNKKVIILGGGTVSHIKSHLALTAPAYGNTARWLADLCRDYFKNMDVELQLTKMACSGDSFLETPEDMV